MKTINIAAYDIVKAGVACQSETPIRLDKLLRLMERNESYIFWLQPLNSNVQAQVPAISINGKFYHPNLKLEKAIFRHVRLSRDFDNQELLEDGTPKLRIPVRLMREKVKSSIRFQGMPLKKPARKIKRTSARCSSKDSGKNKVDRIHVLQTHAANHVALTALPAAQQESGVCLVPSPRALVSAMQRMFEMEFPQHAHRAQFSYTEHI